MVSRLLGIFRKSEPDCHEIRATSSDYIDGDMSEEDCAKLESHIEWCGPCNSFINTLKATVSLLRSTPRAQPPAGFKDRLRDSLSQER